MPDNIAMFDPFGNNPLSVNERIKRMVDIPSDPLVNYDSSSSDVSSPVPQRPRRQGAGIPPVRYGIG